MYIICIDKNYEKIKKSTKESQTFDKRYLFIKFTYYILTVSIIQSKYIYSFVIGSKAIFSPVTFAS